MGETLRLPVTMWTQAPFNHDNARHLELAQPASAMPFDILPTDTRFGGSDSEERCSRCGKAIPDEDVPILAIAEDGSFLYRYHAACVGVTTADPYAVEEWAVFPDEEEDDETTS